MRIRQVRSEFWSDGRVARLPIEVRLTYIGLWMLADDAGWLEWDPVDVATLLYPYDPPDERTARLEEARASLEPAGRVVFYPCGCAHIPTLPDHQRIGGNKSYTVRDKHERSHVHRAQKGRLSTVPTGVPHSDPVQTSPYKSIPGTPVGSEVGSESRERDDDERRALNRAFARQGLPVDEPAS